MTMFNYPPSPLPDEHVASLIFRCFQRTKHLAIEHLFTKLQLTFFDKPSRLWVEAYSEIAKSLEDYYGIDAFISTFSNVPEYGLFLSGQIERGSTDAILTRLASNSFDGALQVSTDRAWRYCPRCATNDEHDYGTSYLHVSHQCFYRLTCKKHKVLLQPLKTKRFHLPTPVLQAEKAPQSVLLLEGQLAYLVERLKLIKSHERKPRLLAALTQKLGVGSIHKSLVYENATLAHDRLAAQFNSSDISLMFEWESLSSGLYPLSFHRGVKWMLSPEHHLHPMFYLWLCHCFLSLDELGLALTSPLKRNGNMATLPWIIAPICRGDRSLRDVA